MLTSVLAKNDVNETHVNIGFLLTLVLGKLILTFKTNVNVKMLTSVFTKTDVNIKFYEKLTLFLLYINTLLLHPLSLPLSV